MINLHVFVQSDDIFIITCHFLPQSKKDTPTKRKAESSGDQDDILGMELVNLLGFLNICL